ncbi:hypothetical protein EJB05_39307, partial [Eragrostis curvula]
MASPGSGEGERAAVGSGERALLRSLDYPCTNRLRARRLLAYHRHHTSAAVYNEMKERTTLIFHVTDLTKLVEAGQWGKACSYIQAFVQQHDSMSHEAALLVAFLKYLMALNDFANGKVIVTCFISDWVLSLYREPALVKYPYLATLVADVLFVRPDHAKYVRSISLPYSSIAFLDWRLVRKKAAEMVEEVVHKTPELRDKLRLPRGPNNLYHLVPLQSSRTCHVKNVRFKRSAAAIARSYIQMKKRLPSEGQGAKYRRFPLTQMLSRPPFLFLKSQMSHKLMLLPVGLSRS